MKRVCLFLCSLCFLALLLAGLMVGNTPTNANGNVASASGSGHNDYLTLSFGAFDHGGGGYTGQATFIDDLKKFRVSIDVECLHAGTSNAATVGGTVVKSTHPDYPVGTGLFFDVVDNGEGVGDKPDTFTTPYRAICFGMQLEAPSDPLQNERGNIQVRFIAPDKDCQKCPAGTHCAGNGECVGGGSNCKDGYYPCNGRCIPKEESCP